MNAKGAGRKRRRGRDLDGILLLDKPRGISSNNALQQVKHIFGARKAGHTGNLDVQANGLLPVCFGEATKVCQFLLDADKRYVSDFTLGARTTTGDSEGTIESTASTAGIGRDAVEAALTRFVGMIEQMPPMHSAIKQNGQPLYKLARQGIEVERQPRSVQIYDIALDAFRNPHLTVDVTCSKGTYIRTLATDLGDELACGAYVSALRRERVGAFDLRDALTIPMLEELAVAGFESLDETLLPPDQALAFLPRAALSDDATYYFRRGQAVLVPRAPSAGLLRLYAPGNRFIGLGEILDDGRVAPRRLFHLHQSRSQEAVVAEGG